MTLLEIAFINRKNKFARNEILFLSMIVHYSVLVYRSVLLDSLLTKGKNYI
jgi:hypothetical protein